MPYFATGSADFSGAAKLGSSLLSPTAFALVISLAGTYEDAGAGVQWANLTDQTNDYSMAAGA
jgi:hypothetical protein